MDLLLNVTQKGISSSQKAVNGDSKEYAISWDILSCDKSWVFKAIFCLK